MNRTPESKPLAFGWWLEVRTSNPHSIYYFGPFTSWVKAESSRTGYIDDLKQEGARVINSYIRCCQPKQLTFVEEELHQPSFQRWFEHIHRQFSAVPFCTVAED